MIGINHLSKVTKYTVYNKTSNIIGSFFATLSIISELKNQILKYESSIRLIQKIWLKNVERYNTRLSVIKRKWNEVIEKLLSQKSKGRKHHSLMRKLRAISINERDNILKRYFKSQLTQYLNQLAIWKKHAANVIIM